MGAAETFGGKCAQDIFTNMNVLLIDFFVIVTALWEEQEAPEYDIDTEDERWLKQQRHPELTGIHCIPVCSQLFYD